MAASAATQTSPSTKRGRVPPARGPILEEGWWGDEDSPAAVLDSLFRMIDRNHSLHGECNCPEHRLIKRYREMTKPHEIKLTPASEINTTGGFDPDEDAEALEALGAPEEAIQVARDRKAAASEGPFTDDDIQTSEEERAPAPRARGRVENSEAASKYTDAKLRKIADDLRFEIGKAVEVEAVCARLIELAEEEGNTESAELFQAVSDWATGNLRAYMRRAVTARSY